MDDGERIAALEQALRDERARRRKAEGRIEDLTVRTEVWRNRAERRLERIDRIRAQQAERSRQLAERTLADKIRDNVPLLERLPLLRRRPAALDGPVSPPVAPRQPQESADPDGDEHDGAPDPAPVTAALDTDAEFRVGAGLRSHPAMPTVRVVACVDGTGVRRCLAAFDVTALAAVSPPDLDDADLVVVEPAALRRADDALRSRLVAWAAEPGRQRLVVWATDPDLGEISSLLARSDVIVADTAPVATELGVPHLPGCFDPALHRPSGPWHPPAITGEESRNGARILLAGDRPVRVEGTDGLLATPPLWLLELAATGVPLGDDVSGSVSARRWAYRHHAPWVRAQRLLALAGVTAPNPLPTVAGLLVSHRPDDIPAAIAGFLRQTYRHTELVVGIHGGTADATISAALAGATIPVRVLELDAALTLGECLNRAAAATSAPVLAKIDDDDHYGPAHLEDSVHALAYSGGEIVGKGAQFTYIAGRDRTVLRRPGQEEMMIDGSPNGATLVFRSEVWDRVGFPHRPRHVDTGFLRAARRIGSRVYAGSRWEFCYVRRPDGHTWAADDAVFLAGSDDAWEGFHPQRVEVPDVATP